MSTIVRDLRDEEEEEDEDGEDEDEGEESEDEDFVPNPASEDESDGEELTFDDDIAEVSTSGKAQAAGKKRRAAAAVGEAKTSKAAKTAKAVKAQKKKARAGGIFDEDDEQPAASTPVEGSASAETDPGAAKAEETAEVSAPAPEPAPLRHLQRRASTPRCGRTPSFRDSHSTRRGSPRAGGFHPPCG